MEPPRSSGFPVFRFLPSEVTEMERLMRLHDGRIPPRFVFDALADVFTASRARTSKIRVLPKQVKNWFHNRRYYRQPRITTGGDTKATGEVLPLSDEQQYAAGSSQTAKPSAALQAEAGSSQSAKPSDALQAEAGSSSGENPMEDNQFSFEAKSTKDGAWYDVYTFLSHRMLDSGETEIMVRFCGFGVMEEEWVNLQQCVRRRSLPCGTMDCVVVLCGDSVLCLQERKEQALYFDARVLNAQRRRHDLRGCRCRFIVRYDHDKTEQIVPLSKLRRRPEYEDQLQQHVARTAFVNFRALPKVGNVDLKPTEKSRSQQKAPKQDKMMEINTDEVTIVVSNPAQDEPTLNTTAPIIIDIDEPSAQPGANNVSGSNVTTKNAKAAPIIIEIDD